MANLRCHDKSCVHNHLTCCGVHEVDVSVNACCLSYSADDATKSHFEQEFAEDLARSICLDDHFISCHDEGCKNNERCCCTLSNLRIDSVNGHPICVNYRAKRS